jgi:hypothetical protein
MSTVAVGDVSKKKAKPEPDPRKPMVFQVRGSEEWKAWVESMADGEGDTLAKLVERSLKLFAKSNGYPDPPRR